MSNDFKQKYVEEALEILGTLEGSVLELENNPHNNSVIEEVFRAMHTLKGGGAMFGFNRIKDITHELETIFDRIRNGQMVACKSLLDITLESIDYFGKLLETNEELDDGDYQDKLIERIVQITCSDNSNDNSKEKESKKNEDGLKEDALYIDKDSELENENQPVKTFKVIFKPNEDILKNGTDPLLLLEELSELGDCKIIAHTDKVPPVEDLDVEKLYLYWTILVVAETIDSINDVFIFVEMDSEISIEEIYDGNIFDNIEELSKVLEKIESGESKNIEKKLNSTEDVVKKDEAKEEGDKKSKPVVNLSDVSNTKAITSIRISSEKVDELMNLVSELVTTQARLQLYSENEESPELTIISENIQKLSRQLRDNAFELSMVPLEKITVRFQRLVRDLATSLNKKIKYTTEGTDTELDKSIIENVADPLMHILRNSLDHGIEDAKERKKAGKPEEGSIKLKAFHSGASVHIQVIDDGKGLDTEKIKEKAELKGLINKGANLSKKEIFDLIFLPGFSTAEKVTDVSGRGVGMDVVRKKISEIRGEIEVESELGKGTTITIKLPLTLSIIDGLLIDIMNDKYIVPLAVVNKIYPIEHAVVDKRFYNLITLEGEQIPFYNLKSEFNYKDSVAAKEQVVVVSYEEKKVGLIVDKVLGEYQAVLKPLGRMYKDTDIFSGATILGDGTVALVMDTNKIVKNYSSKIKKD